MEATEASHVKALLAVPRRKVSPGEIGALHHDVNEVKRTVADLAARVELGRD
jgi:hypothetical protein